jgi:hypothetical protein
LELVWDGSAVMIRPPSQENPSYVVYSIKV